MAIVLLETPFLLDRGELFLRKAENQHRMFRANCAFLDTRLLEGIGRGKQEKNSSREVPPPPPPPRGCALQEEGWGLSEETLKWGPFGI